MSNRTAHILGWAIIGAMAAAGLCFVNVEYGWQSFVQVVMGIALGIAILVAFLLVSR